MMKIESALEKTVLPPESGEVVHYSAAIYYIYKAFFILLLVILVGTLGIGALSVLLGKPIIGALGFGILCILPFLFEKRLKSIFIQNVIFEFSNKDFSIRTEDSSELFRKEWGCIHTYQFYFTPSGYMKISLKMRNNHRRSWMIKDKKTFDQAVKEESVFRYIMTHIHRYNNLNLNHELILPSKGFLNTRLGNIFFWSISLLIVTDLMFRFVGQSRMSFFVLLIAIVMFVQQWIRKIQEKTQYEKVCKLRFE